MSGDDKAALEARMFIPEIETAVVKMGRGIEDADHLPSDAACGIIRETAAKAVQRVQQIPPFIGLSSPYALEIAYLNPLPEGGGPTGPGIERINERTVRIYSDEIRDLPL